MRINSILIGLFIAIAICEFVSGAVVNINTCGNLNVSNTIYNITGNINAIPSTCFYVNASNIVISGNNFRINGTQNQSAISWGINATNINNLQIWNLTIYNFGDYGCGSICAGGGILLYNTNSSQMYNINATANYNGIQIAGSAFDNLQNVTLGSNLNFGLYMTLSNANNVNNTSSIASGNWGFDIELSNSNSFSYCNASYNANDGFTLYNSNTNVLNNTFTYGNTYGLEIQSGSTGNMIYGLYSGGNSPGLDLNNAYNTTIINATLANGNLEGLNIVDASNNTFTNINSSGNILDLQITGTMNELNKIMDSQVYSWNVASRLNLTFINSTYGSVLIFSFNGSGGNLYGRANSDILIANNSLFVNNSNRGLNKSGNISLYSLSTSFSNPKILKNGAICSDCYNFTSLNAGIVRFNVSSFSTYSIAENPSTSTTTNITPLSVPTLILVIASLITINFLYIKKEYDNLISNNIQGINLKILMLIFIIDCIGIAFITTIANGLALW